MSGVRVASLKVAASIPDALSMFAAPDFGLPNKKSPSAGAFFAAGNWMSGACMLNLERETSLELATSTLARLRSTN